MIYPPITLRKDGSYMMCEDASEFDTNYDMPAANAEVAKVEIIAEMQPKDPMDKFADRMSVLYHQVVEPLMRYDFSFENSDYALESCEKLASDTSTIFNVMRIKLLKLAGIVCGGMTEELSEEPFMCHAGTFMKNAALIKQQGVDSYDITWKEVPAFTRLWSVQHVVEVFYNKPEMLRNMIYEAELAAVYGTEYDNNLRNFNGFVDMIQCVLDDRERLNRLSIDAHRQLSCTSMLSNANRGEFTCSESRATHNMVVKYLDMLSTANREIAQTSYELQIKLVDGSINESVYEAIMRPLIHKVINLFGIGIMIGCHFATRMRGSIAVQKGCEAYAKLLLDTIKEHGGIM